MLSSSLAVTCIAAQLGTLPATTTPALEPAASSAEADPEEQVKELYYAGSTLYSAADYAGAIGKFTEALHVATVNHTDPAIRGALLMNLATAHVKSFDIDEDTVHLHKAVHIYGRYLNEAPTLGYPDADVAEAKARKAKLEAQLEKLKGRSEPAPPAPAPSKPAARPSTEAAASASSADTGARRTRGLALAGVGGGLLAGGAAMLAVGAVFKPRAQKDVEKFDDPPDREQGYVDDEARKGVIWMATGGVVAAAGLGMLVGGIVDLRRAKGTKAQAARPRLSPWVGRAGSGLVLSGRF